MFLMQCNKDAVGLFLKVLQLCVLVLDISASLTLQLHGAIYRPDSFVLMLCYSANLKPIRYGSMSLNRIVADKSHRVIVT